MDASTEGLLLMLLGIVLGAFTTFLWRISDNQLHGSPPQNSPVVASVVPPGVATVLTVLGSSALVLDEEGQVLQASAAAYALGLVRDGELGVEELHQLVREVRRDGETRQVDLEIGRGLGRPPAYVQARVAALTSRLVLVIAEDRTRERRVETLRRDFVANVSHELKTPVGALGLLAEAVQEAADDPEAVSRFSTRMQSEASRLERLVQQIIELSRLQGDEAVDRPGPVEVDEVVDRVVDNLAIETEAQGVRVVHEGQRGLAALGNTEQVALALRNLVANAITHSPPGKTVSVSVLPGDATLDITVTDRGAGIPAEELPRIFERFYRVDPARHRSTGGTGLGLSIVKHVAASHGGEVSVWSEKGQGSSFTLRLARYAARPRTDERPTAPPPAPAATTPPAAAIPAATTPAATTPAATTSAAPAAPEREDP